MAELKERHSTNETAANHIIRSGVLLYPLLIAVGMFVWGQRRRYPELFSGTAVLLLAMLTLLFACFASATFLQLKLLPARRRTNRFEQRQDYRGGVTASRPTSGILITFPNLSWRSEGWKPRCPRHQDTGVSARFPCLAIGRGDGTFPYLGCDQSASASPRQRGVEVFGTSVGYQRPRQRGADTRQRLLPFLSMSQSYSRPSLSVISTTSAAWLAAVA